MAPQGAGGRTHRSVVHAMLLTNTSPLSLEWVSNLPCTSISVIIKPTAAERKPGSSSGNANGLRTHSLPSGRGPPRKGTFDPGRDDPIDFSIWPNQHTRACDSSQQSLVAGNGQREPYLEYTTTWHSGQTIHTIHNPQTLHAVSTDLSRRKLVRNPGRPSSTTLAGHWSRRRKSLITKPG